MFSYWLTSIKTLENDINNWIMTNNVLGLKTCICRVWTMNTCNMFFNILFWNQAHLPLKELWNTDTIVNSLQLFPLWPFSETSVLDITSLWLYVGLRSVTVYGESMNKTDGMHPSEFNCTPMVHIWVKLCSALFSFIVKPGDMQGS